MTEIAAIAASILLAGLAAFQLALILGAPIGRFAWGGANIVLPIKLRVASASSILLYILLSVIILSEAGLVTVPVSDSLISVMMWVLTGYFSLGVVLNSISRSKSERLMMTPIVTVLAALFLFVAIQ